MFQLINKRNVLVTTLVVGLAAFIFQNEYWHGNSNHAEEADSRKTLSITGVATQTDPSLKKLVLSGNDSLISPFNIVDPYKHAPTQTQASSQQHDVANAEQITDELLAELSRIISTSENSNHQQWSIARADLLELIDEDPGVLKSLIDRYPSLGSDAERALLKDIFQFTNHDDMEHELMKKLLHESPDDSSLWLDLTQAVGVVHADNQKILLSRLSSLDQPEQIQKTVKALLPDDALSVSNRQVIEALEPLYDHPEEVVRLVVVRKMGEWADHEHGYLLEEILNDPSVSVKEAGVQSLFTSGLQSERIRLSLLKIMQNARTDWNLRRSAFYALKEYPLHGAERDAFLHFEQAMKSPPPVFGEG